MRTGQYMVLSIPCKLIMMGVDINGEVNSFSENEAFLKSSSRPEATIKNKHGYIRLHDVRKALASHVNCVGFLKVNIT